MLKIAIVEDQKVQSEQLKKMVQYWSEDSSLMIEVSTFESGEEFLFKLEDTEPYEIVLMDIQMKNINGMDAARELRKRGHESSLIFITALRDYVFDGYEVGAVNYLLKPIAYTELAKNLNKIMSDYSKPAEQTIIVGKQKIKKADILYIEVLAHETTIYTTDGQISVRQTLSSMLKQLNEQYFIKSHKSFAVNIGRINKINNDSLQLDNDTAIPLSRNNKKTITQQFIAYHRDRGLL